MPTLRRRLAALWFADIVGYSQISHDDENQALEIVLLYQELARQFVQRYDGKLVKFIGDGALAEFPSTEAAVLAACGLRDAFVEQTRTKGFGEQQLRVGVHVGEIATTPDGDVYGDGVNATDRIMQEAEPGQIVVSDDVRRRLRQRKEFRFEDLGQRELKGAGSVTVCSVEVEEGATEWAEIDRTAESQTSLFDELKRRHVFRVAVAYAVVAWLVTQVAAIVVPALFLPAWITRTIIVIAILGFPIALILAWAFELTSQGVRRTPSSDADITVPLAGGRLRRRELIAGAVVALVLAVSWGVWDRWSLGPPAISASTIAVLPFNVRGGEEIEYLGSGMVNLISTKLSGIEGMSSVDPHALLKFVDRADIKNMNPESGHSVAERFGAGMFVLGNVIEAGDQLHLDASIYQSEDSSEPLAQVSVQGQSEALMGLVDQLVGMLLAAQLGESGSRLSSLAAMTTDSLEALKAYVEGERVLRAGRFEDATEDFQRAVSIDPEFALAHYRLGLAASWIPRYGIMEQALDDMLRNSDRLSPPDRVLVESFHALKTNQPAKVRSLLRPYLESHPEDVDALYTYGEVLFNYNDLRGQSITEAKQYYERVVDLDPDMLDVVAERLLAIAAVEGNFAAIDSLRLRIDPGSPRAQQWAAVRAFAIGSPEEQAQILSELREAGDQPLIGATYRLAGYSPGARGAQSAARFLLDPERAPYYHRFGRMFLFTVNLQGGRWSAAKAQIESLRMIDPARAARAFEFEGLYAATPFLAIPETEIRTVREALFRWDPDEVADWTEGTAESLGFHPLYRQYLIGLLSVQLADKESVTEAIEGLRRWDAKSPEIDNLSRFLSRRLEAHVARMEGRSDEALAILSEPAPELPEGEVENSPVLGQPYELFSRAELLHELGRIDEARAWYEVLTEGGSWFNHPYSPIAHLRIARIHDANGEREKAAYHYSRFIDYWKECDEPLRSMVVEAEARLSALR